MTENQRIISHYQYPQPCRFRTNFSRFRSIVGNASLDTRAWETDISKTESNLIILLYRCFWKTHLGRAGRKSKRL